MRVGLTTRTTAISATFLLTAWLISVTLHYWLNGFGPAWILPPPSQLSAIADVLSKTPDVERSALLAAIASTTTVAAIEPAPSPPEAREGRDALADPALASYVAALGPRLLSLRHRPPQDAGAYWPSPPAAIGNLRFRLRLDDGTVLRVDTRAPFVVTVFGLPAGVGAGLIGTVLALLALLALQREIRPLVRLANAVDHIDPTGDPVHLPPIGVRAPETIALVTAFERLQARLQTMVASRFALIGGLQHDVRSFATRLRLRVDHIANVAERDRAAADIDGMIALLDNALLTARAGVGALDGALLDLAATLRDEVADAATSGQAVRLGALPCEREVLVILDRLALRRVLANLIDNAVKYADSATIDLAIERDTALISVSDAGPGIPAEEIDLLFEPFVRREPSRARKTGGAGLGLSVVRSLVEAQNGTVTIGRSSAGGTRVDLRFPLF